VLARHAEAIRHLEKAYALSGRTDIAGALGYALAVAGHTDAAYRLLTELERQAAPPIALAFVHHGLGNDDRAIELFERAVEQRDWHVLILHADPFLASLRLHAGALRLLERIGVSNA
jgi:tetratricopeptide (TPR) repeat protein